MPSSGPTYENRVRKRTPNACNRCRQQKIKCSGLQPCGPCEKRRLPCTFPDKPRSVLVPQGVLAELERDAQRAKGMGYFATQEFHAPSSNDIAQSSSSADRATLRNNITEPMRVVNLTTPISASNVGIDQQSDSDDDDPDAVSGQEEQAFVNPLVSGLSTYTAVPNGHALYLGTSSNWSFGRRVLFLVHNQVFGTPPSDVNLHYDGSAYELGWDGRRTTAALKQPPLPTADFALFLINAVKFHCGQLFHVFDENVFMHYFRIFHEGLDDQSRYPDLWYIHYLLILAMGKSLVGRICKGKKKPSGADLFVYGMQLLPDTTFLWTDPLQSTEILCCIALYLQCLDMRIVAYNFIGQAMRIAIAYGFHTDMPSYHHSPAILERCREIWWTIYIMDCRMSALLGAPRAITERDISARLPSFHSSAQCSNALNIHTKLAHIEGLIQQTVYSKEGRTSEHFLNSIKTALKALADINDERTSSFPLTLDSPSSGISRLSAHLHLFHHQCIILNTKPLLFSFLQRRVETTVAVRIPSSGGVRSLLRVCVGSARQTMKILAALQAQTLLDVFVPFDLESTWSAALVLLITPFIDPSLSKDYEPSLQIVYKVLDEMAAVGNTIAASRRTELEQISKSLARLAATSHRESFSDSAISRGEGTSLENSAIQTGSTHFDAEVTSLLDCGSDDVLSGQQLEAVADSLNLIGPEWLWATDPIDQLDASLL